MIRSLRFLLALLPVFLAANSCNFSGRDNSGKLIAKEEEQPRDERHDTLLLTLEEFLSDPCLKDAAIGYMVVDYSGGECKVLAEHNPANTLIPASTLKLFVTGAALEIIGKPVIQEVITINQMSVNWRSSKLLRRLGQETYGHFSNTYGYMAIHDFWERKGVDLDGIRFDDGNGLSRNNAISPKHLVELLTVMKQSPYYGVFYASLPVAGLSGTMRKALKGTPAVGRVHAKTGSIAGVRSLAGYITSLSGRELVFAIIVNNYTCGTKVLKKKMEQVVLKMTEV